MKARGIGACDDSGYCYPDTATPGTSPGTTSSGTPWWTRMIQTGVDTASSIFRAQYGQPAPGTMIIGPNGTYIRQTSGYPVGSYPVGGGGNNPSLSVSPLLLIAGVVGFAILMRSKK